MSEVHKTLSEIQSKLVAPKGQYNSFGKYNYRSCEDILNALKPLLVEHSATVFLSDEITEVGGRVYVKAIATIAAAGEELAVSAYAREAATKKGMDEAQVTGSASSYARKYALNGLFAIDDTKDADTQPPPPPNQPPKRKPQTAADPVLDVWRPRFKGQPKNVIAVAKAIGEAYTAKDPSALDAVVDSITEIEDKAANHKLTEFFNAVNAKLKEVLTDVTS